MVSTQLSLQLKRLEAPQTELFSEKKIRPSILFSAKDAANCNRDIFYKIGLDGFNELQDINEDFSAYKDELFGIHTKDKQRAVMDKTENTDLSKAINKFLILLSPYLEKQCALKALEWLIYRFMVNEMDVDSLLRCIFPYYESVLFVRILQIIDVKDENNKWHWLFKIQQSGNPLTKSMVFNHWASYTTFRNFMASYIKKALDIHGDHFTAKLSISFYVTTVLGGISILDKVSEDHITSLVKAISKGLSSKNKELLNGTYFIIAQLAVKAMLSEEFIHMIFLEMAKVEVEEANNLRLMCYLAVCHHQRVKKFSPKFIETLIEKPHLLDSLVEFAHSKVVWPFISPYSIGLIELMLDSDSSITNEVKEKKFKKLIKAIQQMPLSPEDSSKIIKDIVRTIARKYEQFTMISGLDIGQMLLTFEQSHPEGYDMAISQLSKKFNKTPHLEEMLKNTENWLSQGEAMFRSLNHPEKNVRVAAVKMFKSKLLNKQIIDPMIVQSNLRSILFDESPKVVLQILNLEDELLKYLSMEEIFSTAQYLLDNKCTLGEKWVNVQKAAFNLLLNTLVDSYSDDNTNAVLMISLQHLLFPGGHDLAIAKTILESQFALSNPILSSMATHLAPLLAEKKVSNTALMDQTWTVLPKVVFKLSTEQNECFLKFLQSNLKSKCRFTQFLSMSILLHFIRGLEVFEDIPITHKLVDACLHCQNNFNILPNECETEEKTSSWVHQVKSGSIPLNFIQECLMSCIQNFSGLCSLLDNSPYWNFTSIKKELGDNDGLLLLVKILKSVILMESIDNSQHLQSMIIKHLFSVHFKTTNNRLYFLSMIWSWQNFMAYSELIDKKLQIWTLNLGLSLFNSEFKNLSWVLSTEEPIMPSLIASLCYGGKQVRKLSVKCIQALHQIELNKKIKNSYYFLIKSINDHAEELMADSDQLAVVIDELYESHNTQVMHIVDVILDKKLPDHIRSSLLFGLSNVKDIEILKRLLPIASNLIDQLNSNGKTERDYCYVPATSICLFYIFLKFSPETAPILDVNEGWQLFLKATNSTDDVMKVNNQLLSPQTVILDQVINHKFFLSIEKSEVQAELWMILVNKVTYSQNSKEASQLRKSLKKVSLHASLIVNQIKKLGLIFEAKSAKQVRAKQIEMTNNQTGEEMMVWHKLLLILELIPVMNNLEAPWLLVGPLCKCLKSSYTYEFEINDIVQQQILSTLYHLVEVSLKQLDICQYGKIQINIENIIQCIRTSVFPDIHRRALHLLSLGVTLCPEEVLNNIMAIFTFMGTSLLRRDDSYSFQVIQQTIESIIPTLIKKGSDKKTLIEKIAQVTQVFVDALADVPEHRRLSLFKQLAITLGVRENLWLIPTLLIYSHITKGSLPDVDPSQEKQKMPKNIIFALSLNSQFSVVDQVQVLKLILHYIVSLPINNAFDDNMNCFLNLNSKVQIIKWHMHTTKQFRHFLYSSIGILNNLVASDKFIRETQSLSQEESKELLSLYQVILEDTFCLLDILTKKMEQENDEVSEKFWSTNQRKAIEFIDRINSLLPPRIFVSVIEHLLKSSHPLVRCRAMEMLCGKLQSGPDYFDESYIDILLPFIQNLKLFAFDSKQPTENRQIALFAIQLLIRSVGEHIEGSVLKSLLLTTIQIINQASVHAKVISQCILVAAECVITLKTSAIEHLPQLLPPLYKFIQPHTKLDEEVNEYLVLTTLTAIHKILETMPKFMGRFSVDLIFSVCMLSAYQDKQKFKESRISHRISSICDGIASSIEPRILVHYLTLAYDLLLQENIISLSTLLVLVQKMIMSTDEATLSNFQSSIVKIITQVFELRTTITDVEKVDIVEDHANETFTKLLLRLKEFENEELYSNFFNWAEQSVDKYPLRLISFYRFSSHLASTYKRLFISTKLVNIMLSHACMLLERNNSLNYKDNVFGTGKKSETNTCTLLKYILQTLTTVFLYDTVNFTTPEKFNMILGPVIHQLENKIGTEDEYQERVTHQLKPCIVKMTVAVGDDLLWKKLNKELLLKVRNDDTPMIILAALEVFQGLMDELGEDYLQPLLADIMPYITEVIESLDSRVEARTREVLMKMEEILGDNLRAYLTP